MAIVENDPSARMQVRTLGQLKHPASCMVCGSGNCDDGYLDLGVFFDYEGTMYLCMTCITQAGETVGMYTPEEMKISIQGIDAKLEALMATQKELEDAKRTINSLTDLLRPKFQPSSISSGSTNEAKPLFSGTTTELTDTTDDRESEPEEPTPFPRRSDSKQSKLRNPTFE